VRKEEIVGETNSKLVSGTLASPNATAKQWTTDVKAWTAEVCRLVNERYKELGDFQGQLEERAGRLRRIGRVMKGLLIVLGALSTTKATFDAFMDPNAKQSIAVFAILGVLTTIIAGLSAAFKPEESGGQLAGLAAEVASTRGMILYTWDRILLEHAGTLASVTDDQSEIKLVEELLERLNVKTGDIYTRAAGLGMQPPKGPEQLREFTKLNTPQLDTPETFEPFAEPATA
jgi:hypothetical protein